ncbi:MAG: WG repeat-containing protein, partial [Clostridia bacterium]|nr:WG repeat-containing protein [Clostridia bacterium]
MTERILFAMNDLPDDMLAECEDAMVRGLPAKPAPAILRFLEPIGYAAMLALVVGTLILAPTFLHKKPAVSPSDTTETTATHETEETVAGTDEKPPSVDRDLASYMMYLPNFFHEDIEIRDGTVFREDISDLLMAFCAFEHERLDFVSREEAEGVGIVTVKREDLLRIGKLLLGETFDLADYRAYWSDPSSNAISRYDEATDCFTVEMNRNYWGGEPYCPVFGAEPEYRYDGNTVTVTVPVSYQEVDYEGQRITFSYRCEKLESDGMLFYRLKSVTAVPPTALAPLTATWNGKTVTVKYDVITHIAYPDDMGYIYFCNGYAIFFDYGEDPDNLAFSEEGEVWGCIDRNGNCLFSFICDGITNFDENGVAVAAFHTSDASETEYYFINTKGEKTGIATKEDFNTWWSQYEIDVLPPEALGLTVNPAYEESGEGFPYYFGDRGVWEYGTVWNGLVFMNFDDEGIVLMDTEGNTVLPTDYSFSPTHLGGLLLSEGRLVTAWNGYLAILTV